MDRSLRSTTKQRNDSRMPRASENTQGFFSPRVCPWGCVTPGIRLTQEFTNPQVTLYLERQQDVSRCHAGYLLTTHQSRQNVALTQAPPDSSWSPVLERVYPNTLESGGVLRGAIPEAVCLSYRRRKDMLAQTTCHQRRLDQLAAPHAGYRGLGFVARSFTA
jgi:hypothetical protein